MLHHPVESVNNKVTNYQIIGKGYCPHTPKRKISEALSIKNKKPLLNKQDKSVCQQLFNLCIQLFYHFNLNNR